MFPDKDVSGLLESRLYSDKTSRGTGDFHDFLKFDTWLNPYEKYFYRLFLFSNKTLFFNSLTLTWIWWLNTYILGFASSWCQLTCGILHPCWIIPQNRFVNNLNKMSKKGREIVRDRQMEKGETLTHCHRLWQTRCWQRTGECSRLRRWTGLHTETHEERKLWVFSLLIFGKRAEATEWKHSGWSCLCSPVTKTDKYQLLHIANNFKPQHIIHNWNSCLLEW